MAAMTKQESEKILMSPEFVREWDHKMHRVIEQKGFPPSENADLRQKLWSIFYGGDGKHFYPEIYDPEKGGTIATFMYRFIDLYLRQFRTQRAYNPLNKADSQISSEGETEDIFNFIRSSDTGGADKQEFEELISFVEGELAKVPPARSMQNKKGEIIERSLLSLFRRLLPDPQQGVDPSRISKKEIAEDFGISSAALSYMMNALKKVVHEAVNKWNEINRNTDKPRFKPQEDFPQDAEVGELSSVNESIEPVFA